MRTLVIATLLTLLTACAGSPAAPQPQTVGSAGNPVLPVAYTPMKPYASASRISSKRIFKRRASATSRATTWSRGSTTWTSRH